MLSLIQTLLALKVTFNKVSEGIDQNIDYLIGSLQKHVTEALALPINLKFKHVFKFMIKVIKYCALILIPR